MVIPRGFKLHHSGVLFVFNVFGDIAAFQRKEISGWIPPLKHLCSALLERPLISTLLAGETSFEMTLRRPRMTPPVLDLARESLIIVRG